MRGVPTEPCMQAPGDWKECIRSSIDSLVPYPAGFLLYFCLLKWSIHRIQIRATANKDLGSRNGLCAAKDTCSLRASTTPRP